MPREIRTLKRSFFTDEKMADVPREVRLTFLGLIANADDEGRLRADPRLLKANIYPLDESITASMVAADVDQLEAVGRVRRYTVDGTLYLEVLNFSKHQVMNRKYRSDIPAPPDRTDDAPPAQEVRTADAVREHGRSGAEEFDDEMKRSGAEASAGPVTYAPDPDPMDLEDPPAPPAPLVVLPTEAEKFVDELYGLATEKRRLDVRRQLYDTLDPNRKGARLSRGTFVRARDAKHLAECCEAVRLDPPRDLDRAIVILLQKLQDPPKGPSPTEVAAKAEAARVQEEERYQAAAKAAGMRWANENQEEYREIAKAVNAKFRDALGSSFGKLARDAELIQLCAHRAGFPDFEAWRADEERKREQRMGQNAAKLDLMGADRKRPQPEAPAA